MAEKRRLAAEMEKVFRKVDEGVELFMEIQNKMAEANSDNQRDKFQDDLKKEIKKLQRLRDQIKNWQNSNDIKDKEKLIQYRKVIEQRMEQFKDIERENKTKPHSKQGLCAEEKLDPKVKEKEDTIGWLQNIITRLMEQQDFYECEIENIAPSSGSGRKKKVDKDKLKKVEPLKLKLDKHKYHLQKLEVLMRLINNDTVDCADVGEDLKEALMHYTEQHDEVDDIDSMEFYEWIYDDLKLGDMAEITQQLGNVTNIGTLEEADNVSDTQSHPSGSPSTSPPPPPLKEGSKEPESTTSTTAADTAKQRHTSGGEFDLQRTTSVGSGGGAAPGPRSVPVTPLKLTQQTSLDSTTSGLSTLVSPPATVVAAPTTTPPLATAAMPYNSVAARSSCQTTRGTPASTAAVITTRQHSVATTGTTQAGRTSSPTFNASPNATSGRRSVDSQQQQQQNTQAQRSKTPVSFVSLNQSLQPPVDASTTGVAPLDALKMQVRLDAVNVSPQQLSPSQTVNVSSSSSSVIELQQRLGAMTVSQQQPQQQQQSQSQTPSVVTQQPQPADLTGSSSLSTPVQPQQQPNHDTTAPTPPVMSLKSLSEQAIGSDPQSLAASFNILGGSNVTASQQPTSANILPALGASPLGKLAPTTEQQRQLQALEAAMIHMPLPMDSERQRMNMIRAPYATPAYYPQTPPPMADTFDYFLRLTPETLFFIFYYMEGTKAQYLAAKALKNKSWRFHKKYLMWFQRHEEPKVLNDDFETGTYIYFDFEKWSQRKRENFTFEYKFLEDRELN